MHTFGGTTRGGGGDIGFPFIELRAHVAILGWL